MIRIVTDSSSGISPHLAAEMGVTVMPLKISFGAEVYRDGVDIDREGFYTNLTRAAALPTIQPPTLAEFQEVYSRVGGVGDPIIALPQSS